MNNLQRLGGIAALLEAVAFIVGFALAVALLAPADYASLDIDTIEHVEFLVDNEAVWYVWNLIIYVAFGILLVPLSLALYERLKGAPALAQMGAAFGLIWAGLVIASGMLANIGAGVVIDVYQDDPARASDLWLSLEFVTEGLGGGNEIVGGIWALLVAAAALQTAALPRFLNVLGVIVGAAGVLTAIPPVSEAFAAVFGLGLIVWFAWAGIAILREPRTPLRV